jgi:hypothetical protein
MMLGEGALASVKKGDILQLRHKGYFIVDSAPGQQGAGSPLVLADSKLVEKRSEWKEKKKPAVASEKIKRL